MKLSISDIREAAEILGREAENAANDLVFVVHPDVWNGYWSIHERSHFLRWLGRRLKSRMIYSWGLRVEWIHGLKEYVDETGQADDPAD